MFESILTFQSRYRPVAVALATSSGQASFAELDGSVERFAARLQGEVKPGQHVTVQAEAVGLHWTLLLALARLGCATSSLALAGERAVGLLLDALDPDLVVSERPLGGDGRRALAITPDWLAKAYASPAAEPVAAHRFAPDQPARVVLSSGTTGAPKAMVLTRSVLDARIRSAGLSRLAHRRLHSRLGLDAETGFRAPLTAWATGSAVTYPDAGVDWAQFLQASAPETLLLVPAQLGDASRSVTWTALNQTKHERRSYLLLGSANARGRRCRTSVQNRFHAPRVYARDRVGFTFKDFGPGC